MVAAMEQAFAANFPSLAKVTPPKGFNHTCVGSSASLAPANLVSYSAALNDGRDLREWHRMRVKVTAGASFENSR